METFDFILSLIPIGIGILVVGLIAFQVAWSLLNPKEVEKLNKERQQNEEEGFLNDDDNVMDEILGIMPGAMNSDD